MEFIKMLDKMANDDKFRPIAIKLYGDLYVWNDLYQDWLQIDGKGLLKYNFPNSLKNEIEIVEEK
jgi:hypothetical protein